ncbi:crotonyl-CoA carboxylase/reductase [Conexibacter sp. CPCC 206217]|nr:crotonyl-CoA carboxylase/reductase [Conexibacter sp. CPCC 206217]MDO8210175.1 crotonyl-CoA carboxylase/reductase [Conexibacter sp. CPCC 206217]
MYAQVIRQDRFGDPRTAFQVEQVDVPAPGADEVLVAVMAAGINYNNVWAARGLPVDVIGLRQRAGEPHDFHIGGSDASGIVYAVGDEVTSVAVGDEVVVHPGCWDPADAWVAAGRDPMLAPSARIWGYDTNFGSFAQFTLAQEHQILPKAPHLTWEEAAASTLVGTTAYRMLHGWAGNELHEGDGVLVWGGSGGVGVQAIQLVRAAGATAVAVVSDDERGRYAVDHGAVGYIDRTEFSHWGVAPHWQDDTRQTAWQKEARAFKRRVRDLLGRDPAIVVEHPGEATLPTSAFVCARGGMVVICAGTTGYSATLDLRHQWVMQKRLQGAHGTNDEQARAYNRLLLERRIDPAVGEVLPFEGIPAAHADMGAGVAVFGNRVALVGAPEPGLGAAS